MTPMENKPVFTMITGASSGLGKEFAIESARRHKNLILVALPGRNLQQLCEELAFMYGVKAYSLECDLTNEDALDKLAAYVISNFSVNQLVNNAGIGGAMRFADASSKYLDNIIHLNIRATTMLTRLMLPELLLHKKALILNIASIAAFAPIPYKSIYPASKAFIYSFSRSLSKELQGTGVRVVVVNPGQIVTNPEVTFRIMRQGFFGKTGLLSAGKIARISLSAAENGQEVIVPGITNKLTRLIFQLLPESFMLNLLEKTFKKELSFHNIFK